MSHSAATIFKPRKSIENTAVNHLEKRRLNFTLAADGSANPRVMELGFFPCPGRRMQGERGVGVLRRRP